MEKYFCYEPNILITLACSKIYPGKKVFDSRDGWVGDEM